MVTVFVSSAVDRGSIFGRVNPKTIKLLFAASPLSTQHLGVKRKNNDWLVWNQDIVFKWRNMSSCGLFFQ